MNRKNLRKVSIIRGDHKGETAYFHQFGHGALEGRSGENNIMWSTAIVELEDGTVIETEPSYIKFLN